MFDTIYIEENILKHPRVIDICSRFPGARVISCNRYGEVFNPKAQNFRLQKQNPALILAEKFNNFVLEAPAGYGIGGDKNYYFSHMLNCIYDCRYCFLQGMYQSANYVLFVNYDDFQNEIQRVCLASTGENLHFFSGYDCDSLAVEPVTEFAKHFLPFFAKIPNAWLELRTKSTQIRSLLSHEPYPRCIVAFSLSLTSVEDKAPSLQRRLDALSKLQENGWLIGLRFDPLIYQTNYRHYYQQLFERVFAQINIQQLHSVSLGMFRLPEKFFKKIHTLYPEEKLFAGTFVNRSGLMTYQQAIEQEMMDYCSTQILNYIPKSKFFPCQL